MHSFSKRHVRCRETMWWWRWNPTWPPAIAVFFAVSYIGTTWPRAKKIPWKPWFVRKQNEHGAPWGLFFWRTWLVEAFTLHLNTFGVGNEIAPTEVILYRGFCKHSDDNNWTISWPWVFHSPNSSTGWLSSIHFMIMKHKSIPLYNCIHCYNLAY